MTTSLQEERVQRLEHEMKRQEAYHAVANIATRVEHFTNTGQYDRLEELYAMKSPDVRAQIGPWGIWEGPEGIKKFVGFHKYLADKAKETGEDVGVLNVSIYASPVIEISQDGETARGLWICPALITRYIGGKLQTLWSWQKRAFDFVLEDGNWKIWHYHVYGLFTCPYDKSPVDIGKWDPMANVPALVPDEFKPDRPTTDFWIYDPEEVVKFIPAPPDPYVMFSETESY